MREAFGDQEAGGRTNDRATEPVRYPMHHVVGVLDTEEKLTEAVVALVDGGFLASEVDVATGAEKADRVRASPGRGGLAGLAIRIGTRLGLENEETELKALYEQAMRDGRFVVRVEARTEARKDLATNILTQHGAHTVSYFGRFTIETVVRPDGS
jgi:hypothetical protein